jgi:VanZ family protein
MRMFFKYWLPVFIWLAVIFAGSTGVFSAEQTSRYFVPFLRWLNPQISPSAIATIHVALRKLGHLTEYAILAALIWRALRSARILRAKISRAFVGAWVACAIFAVSDEFHQAFALSRTAAFGDVLIDICGALIGLAICSLDAGRRNRTSLTEN